MSRTFEKTCEWCAQEFQGEKGPTCKMTGVPVTLEEHLWLTTCPAWKLATGRKVQQDATVSQALFGV